MVVSKALISEPGFMGLWDRKDYLKIGIVIHYPNNSDSESLTEQQSN